MTLNSHYGLYCTNVHLLVPTPKVGMKIDPYYQQQKCSPVTLVSGSIKVMQIFMGFPVEWASDDSGVVNNLFSMLSLAITLEPLEIRPTL